jgi:hypothetical protein
VRGEWRTVRERRWTAARTYASPRADVGTQELEESAHLGREQELVRAADSAALVAAMKRRYPDAGMGVALDIGTKVAKREMKWG